MKTSELKSIAVNVIAIPDEPILRLNDIKSQEDNLISFREIYNEGIIMDKDGSEMLHFEIRELPIGVRIINTETNNIVYNGSIDEKKFIFDEGEIDKLAVEPTKDFSGIFEIDWWAISTEKSNGLTNSSKATSIVSITSKADIPNPLKAYDALPTLSQDGSIKLNKLFKLVESNNLLTDIDGSEELIAEIRIPKELRLVNDDNGNWLPIRQEESADKTKKIYEIYYSDLNLLSIKDQGASILENIGIEVRLVSREKKCR